MCSWQRLLHHLLTHTHSLRIVCVCMLFNDFTSSLLINVDPQELFPVLVVSYVSQNASEHPEKCQKIVLMLLFFFLRAPSSPPSKRNTSEAKMKLRKSFKHRYWSQNMTFTFTTIWFNLFFVLGLFGNVILSVIGEFEHTETVLALIFTAKISLQMSCNGLYWLENTTGPLHTVSHGLSSN